MAAKDDETGMCFERFALDVRFSLVAAAHRFFSDTHIDRSLTVHPGHIDYSDH